ncbi:molybdenum cofactor guanylyltransferase MobA [Methylobacterium gregans]|uniref:Molybdenum cofactor guanylyltransferase n=1 Tax=Methylobacterium gregans TaxID=374424 RepID=A0AA37MCQ3_9HYPH|nr:molybdenum cofactor guanylyltransferase MobA [Methylobacterium gregans]MDQ0519247.1 molybdopterin-guanine dinucleotide biosynthesis protein A [Methylobacterium gregans]GJD80026.1 Molybdenum cofactor guanylyltransferase [Methylobacterium gregans]GLS53114.1 molybdenum cofactor guanylyltransferase [Methylobacterium gregans]
MSTPVLGLILAGGRARRMGGGDKPLLDLGGRTLLARAAERLAAQCGAGLALSANGDPARFVGFPGPVLPDTLPGQPGPLAGILAGLEHAASLGVAAIVSVSGDAPFLPEDLVARLVAVRPEAGIALAASGERRHYTIALWPAALRDDLRLYLESGERRVGGFIARHPAEAASWSVAPVDPFLNINTPEDLAAAEAMLALSAPPPV